MRTARFFAVFSVCCLLPFSSTAQSVSVRLPLPTISLVRPLPSELHAPSVFPMSLDDSGRDLPVQEQEIIQKSF